MSGKSTVGKKGYPLLYETTRRGVIYIKVANPNVFIKKKKYVWEQVHPDEKAERGDLFLSLDGDENNFDPANIMRVTRQEFCYMSMKYGPLIKGNPERNSEVIAQSKLHLRLLDAGEKAGLVWKSKNRRVFRDVHNAKKRERYASRTPEERRKYLDYEAEKRRERRARMTPEELAEVKAKHALSNRKYRAKMSKEKYKSIYGPEARKARALKKKKN